MGMADSFLQLLDHLDVENLEQNKVVSNVVPVFDQARILIVKQIGTGKRRDAATRFGFPFPQHPVIAGVHFWEKTRS